ncbi:MAG: hypothetical protein ABW292_21560 [Vicinamibacterales bacterium]
MLRKVCSVGLIGLLLCAAPVSADPGDRATARQAKASTTSGSKRVLWTVAGIGAGFAAGLFIGLNAFDDSVNSDRKVWTSALVGAAAGGLAGNLLGKIIGRTPAVRVDDSRRPAVDVNAVSWTEVTGAQDPTLRRRVRAVNSLGSPAR